MAAAADIGGESAGAHPGEESGLTETPLLFLTHRIPYPPNKGDKIRSYHLLRALSERYRVHLGTFVDHEHDWRYLPEVERLCADVCAVRLNPTRRRLASLSGLVGGKPLSVPYYRSAALGTWVRRKVYEEGISRLVFFSSPMAQYAPSNGVDVRKIVDFVDVDSEKWLQYAGRRSWPLSWLYRREGKRLLDFEREVASAADASVFVTREEADLFRRRAGVDDRRVRSIVNGVDTSYFSPERPYERPYGAGGPVIAFTGMMNYWANVDAVTWFTREVFPRVRERVEGVRFAIIGAQPAREVEHLAGNGVEVTGAVDDVRPYLAHADVAVAPLRVARGIQNKVLEAMAMAKPVVSTTAALEGLDLPVDLRHGVDAVQPFADTVVGLLSSPEERRRLGTLGRAWVQAHHDWARTLTPVFDLIENRGGNEDIDGRA
jgi:sugar transferase (PEP-CTERM/EpsH1 system associated)